MLHDSTKSYTIVLVVKFNSLFNRYKCVYGKFVEKCHAVLVSGEMCPCWPSLANGAPARASKVSLKSSQRVYGVGHEMVGMVWGRDEDCVCAVVRLLYYVCADCFIFSLRRWRPHSHCWLAIKASSELTPPCR